MQTASVHPSRQFDLTLFNGHPEIDKILNRLAHNAPLFVTISGKPGVGKSAFVCEALLRAEQQQGWRTIGKKERELQIDSSATKESFSAQLVESLQADQLASFSSNRAVSGDASEGVVQQLRAASPVVIGIGRFWPTREFVNWFAGEFVSKIKLTGAAIAILCAGLHTDQLSALADYRVNLDTLEESWAREMLSAAGARIAPPLDPNELSVYARQLSARPELLASLLRVFRLAETST
jgi:hypothetical protein